MNPVLSVGCLCAVPDAAAIRLAPASAGKTPAGDGGGCAVLESLRGVLWARRRQPDEVAYLLAAAHERFSPRELVEQAAASHRVRTRNGHGCS